MLKSFKTLHYVQQIGLAVVLGCTFLVGSYPGNASAATQTGDSAMSNYERTTDAGVKDSDGDGVLDREDYDDDNDGVADTDDAFPLDASKWLASHGPSTKTKRSDSAQTQVEPGTNSAAAIAARGFAKSVRTDADYQVAIDELVAEANAIVGGQSGLSKSKSATAPISIQPTGEGITITTLRGLRDAGLPKWAELEALEEFGYTSWREVPDDQLDLPIEPQAFSLDAMEVVEQVVAAQSQNSTQAKGLFNLCPTRWSDRHWDDSVRISESGRYAPINESSPHGHLQGSLSGSIQGEAIADIDYATKARKCIGIPYKARLDAAFVDMSLYVDGSVDLNGSALLEWQRNLQRNFQLFSKTFEFKVKIFTFQLRLQSDLTVGAKIDARAKANINARADLLGEVEYRWECTGSQCNRTKAEERLEFSTAEDNGYDANIDVTVIPYIEVSADLRFRLKNISTLVEARAAIVAAAPASLHLAACGEDIDADGKIENSAGAYFDVSLEIYTYFSYAFLSRDAKMDSISLGLPGFKKVTVPGTATSMYTSYPGHGLPKGDITLHKSVKVLATAELTNANISVLRPVLSLANGGISISQQRCYPFASAPTYVIDWNDGTPSETVTAGLVTHRGLGNSNQSVSVRIVGDELGRTFSSPATVMQVAAISAPTTPTTPTTPTGNPRPIPATDICDYVRDCAAYKRWYEKFSGSVYGRRIYAQ